MPKQAIIETGSLPMMTLKILSNGDAVVSYQGGHVHVAAKDWPKVRDNITELKHAAEQIENEEWHSHR